MFFKRLTADIVFCTSTILFFSATAAASQSEQYLKKYAEDSSVRYVILVSQDFGKKSAGTMKFMEKGAKGTWKEIASCTAVLGKNGLFKQKEGDARTPAGDFSVSMAFGAKKNPGTKIPYTQLTNSMYVCSDSEFYNKFIDTKKVRHVCRGEHLIKYLPQYNYALFLNYNAECVPGRGSAIFLHCKGKYPFTMGCVALPEEIMKKILIVADRNVRVCIFSSSREEQSKKALPNQPDVPKQFVVINDIIPDAIVDIRYASNHNFMGKVVKGYEEPVAIGTQSMAKALKAVADELRPKGYSLKIFDSYRPQRAVDNFLEWLEDSEDPGLKEEFYPEEEKSHLLIRGYIAKKSGHSRGSTVDLTLCRTDTGKEIDMGGCFDYFGDKSHVSYQNISTEQKANRKILQDAMLKHGFKGISKEWWHFTLKNEPYPSSYFDFPVNNSSLR